MRDIFWMYTVTLIRLNWWLLKFTVINKLIFEKWNKIILPSISWRTFSFLCAVSLITEWSASLKHPKVIEQVMEQGLGWVTFVAISFNGRVKQKTELNNLLAKNLSEIHVLSSVLGKRLFRTVSQEKSSLVCSAWV